ncbi:2OG-Fe(II) oxygenase [Sorangium cellulosum]|uniref:2OG-Fe(II) oxygenase n=1 Tax=Sorangium cellulosum TaxID=56 RepID=UPI0010125906|nr:2OG-Fe(II) oxygenase [Sorangium cellulosum]
MGSRSSSHAAPTICASRSTGSAPSASRSRRSLYLLDHEYTQRSLGWGRLKNADRLRASALREVAARLDCEAFLALADVHECWSCEGDDWNGGYGRRALGRWGHEGDGAGDADGHELVDLNFTDVELRHWVDADGQVAPGISTRTAMHEVCFTRASTEMDPFRSEHEGYMGNYGNTVDRWYHRAALVMWPRARRFVIRAKVSPSWAVDELASRVEAGATDEARDRAKELLPFWRRVAPNEASEAFVRDLLSVAVALDDGELAFGLLSPLGPHRLSPRTTPAFVTLVQHYGLSWSQRLFSAWQADARHDTPPWRSLLPHLCEALWAGGEHGEALAMWLLSREVASFQQRHAGACSLPQALGEVGLDRLLDDLVALLETAAVIRAPAVRDDLIAFLTAPETALPLMTAGALLRRCREGRAPAAVRALGLQPLYRRVVELLERAVAARPRSPEDWSIEPPSGCTCPLCRELSEFLRDRSRIQLAWPLAKARRSHIHGVIDLNRLPVAHTTLRRGSPYTLVLTKQEALFERDAALRAQQKALLGWLEEQRSAFSEIRPSIAPS